MSTTSLYSNAVTGNAVATSICSRTSLQLRLFVPWRFMAAPFLMTPQLTPTA
ncbi:MAG: hypothetical protein PT944_04850 [Actinomycetaceae bacterium]|nr:hypothetical protein [Arcanobacterium sp.]MDD7687228.1 hypothetical protein [Actinomycetaceae bacterium]MDY5273474.1 hypothetical protein [Arcanobacterium sp.]